MLADGRVKSGACASDVCSTLAEDSDSVSLPHDTMNGVSVNPIKETRITRQLMFMHCAMKSVFDIVLKFIVACNPVFRADS